MTAWGDSDKDLLREMAEGKTNQEIGRTLHFSPETIRTYIKVIASKLGVRGRRAKIVSEALRKGIIK